MSKSFKWTEEILKVITNWRADGKEWKEIAHLFNKKYGQKKSAANIRTAYKYHCSDEELELENQPDIIAARRRSQISAAAANRQVRTIAEGIIAQEDFLNAMEAVASNLKPAKPVKMQSRAKGTKMTAELLLSDLQIGKLIPGYYNTEIARKRIQKYCEAVIFKIKQHQKSGYKFDKIVLAMLGDLIESDKKHPNSARATDTSTAEQLANCQEYLFVYLIEPLAKLGIPMDVVCVTGNHDHDDHGLAQFAPGKNHLSWPLYHAMRMFTKARGYKHVSFSIPQGAFHLHEIYGHNVLYEHGVGVGATEASMFSRRAQRSQQLGKGITYFRMGDKHHISRYNEDTLVVNGAFFGGDCEGLDYSSINGYSSQPGQVIFFHVPRNEPNRLPVYDSFIIQLGHIQ